MKNSEPFFRVLYAEDNEDACELVTILLSFSNIEVIAAATIAEAWQLAQKEHFDLYLLDSEFPEGSGLDLCRTLREYAPQAPILFYSANAYAADVQNGLAAGADAYLIKPYDHDLAETIIQAIDDHKNSADCSNDFFVELRKTLIRETTMNYINNQLDNEPLSNLQNHSKSLLIDFWSEK